MAVDEATLKGGGFIKLRQPDRFAVRVKVLGGDANSAQLRAISEIAEKFGDGEVHFTVRQCVEIRGVKADDFDGIHAALRGAGLGTGACGPRVRVPVACPGSATCKRGLNDTVALARRLDEELADTPILPHKFKTGVTGCSASCAKPQENDLGFRGSVQPIFDQRDGACIACGVCARVCPTGAISLDENGQPVIDLSECDFEGKCISSCPTRAIRAERTGWTAYIGGTFGSNPRLGVIAETFVDDDRALELAHSAIEAYQRLGKRGERLRDVMDRMGHDEFIREVTK